jgi:hypothetical protein
MPVDVLGVAEPKTRFESMRIAEMQMPFSNVVRLYDALGWIL